MHQAPENFQQPGNRWSLESLLRCCGWLQLHTRSGLCRLLKRLDIGYKRARDYVHSPDRDYGAKVAYLQSCWQLVQDEPARFVLLYLDEFAFERQPTLAPTYHERGQTCPLARRSQRSNTQCRGLGALNALTGQVIYLQRTHITTAVLSAFYAQLAAAYPEADTIFVVQDNWPVHVHPNVLARLQPQRSPFWPHVPDNWPTQPSHRAVHDSLPIQLCFLPTYSPWLNPIEKLWRWLRQQVLHLHRFSDDWPQLKQRVLDFIAQFQLGSLPLLRYVGLLPP